jgi:hypothetical protein
LARAALHNASMSPLTGSAWTDSPVDLDGHHFVQVMPMLLIVEMNQVNATTSLNYNVNVNKRFSYAN